MAIESFLLLAAAGGSALAVLSGPIGSFLVWQRRTFLADSLAHSALLGAALSQLIHLPPFVGVLSVALIMALWLSSQNQTRDNESKLTIASSTCLALGFMVLALIPHSRTTSLEALLFGDLLLLLPDTVARLWVYTSILLIGLIWFWKPLLRLIISPEIAQAQGLPVQRYQRGLIICISLIIALFFEHTGVLLLTGLLIIPVLTVQPWVRTPEQMAIAASILAIIAVNLGIAGSLWLNTPCSPTIVTLAASMYASSTLVRKLFI